MLVTLDVTLDVDVDVDGDVEDCLVVVDGIPLVEVVSMSLLPDRVGAAISPSVLALTNERLVQATVAATTVPRSQSAASSTLEPIGTV